MGLTIILAVVFILIVVVALVLHRQYTIRSASQDEPTRSYIEYVNNWLKVTGKLYMIHGLLIYLVLSPFIKQIPFVEENLPGDKYVIPMIAACLWLMVQIFMGMFKGEDKEFTLRKYEKTEAEFKERLKSVRQLDILCSSSETFYPILKDLFSQQKIECRMLLRHPLKGIDKQKKEMLYYSDTYAEIKGDNKECNLTIKYCSNTFSRLIIIDNTEVYFGFYKLDRDRLRAKDIEMIHATTGSHLGNFLINIAKNRFQSIWDIADDEIKEREKLIY